MAAHEPKPRDTNAENRDMTTQTKFSIQLASAILAGVVAFNVMLQSIARPDPSWGLYLVVSLANAAIMSALAIRTYLEMNEE